MITRAKPLPHPTLLGVVHLPPLPGSPLYGESREELRGIAYSDAEVLLNEGLDGFVVENFGDLPFHANQVESIVIAEITVIAQELRRRHGADFVLGINVLRNDADAALAVAAAVGAHFVRVNVHNGVMVCDQGLIEGDAAATLRKRRSWGASEVSIFADVGVKHATPLPGFKLENSARDLIDRAGADGLIVTGTGTGAPTPLDDVGAVRTALGKREVPIWIGSGATAASIGKGLEVADGAIVGTTLKEDCDVRRKVDPARVREFVLAARQ